MQLIYNVSNIQQSDSACIHIKNLYKLNHFVVYLFGKDDSGMGRHPSLGNLSSMGQVVKNLPTMQETQEVWVQTLGQEDPLERKMATHSSILWTEEPGGLQSIGLQRAGHD